MPAESRGRRGAVTCVDLFCGAGGLSLGLQTAGLEVVAAADSWGPAVESYNLNFPKRCVQADLSRVDGADLKQLCSIESVRIDLVVGGPPCQGFSVQRIGPESDPRNNLVLDFARLVAQLSPSVFIMENVPGLLGSRGIGLASAFEEAMCAAGYSVEAVRIDASLYGVPQSRKRVFYYGWRAGLKPFKFPGPVGQSRIMTVGDAIGDLPEPPGNFEPAPGDVLHRRTRLSELNQRRISLIPPGGGMQDLPAELRAECHRNGPDRIGHRYVYGRMAPDRPAPTITARFDSFTRGKFGHPTQSRNLTLREGARLQTFPDSFRFQGTQEEIAALIGNAVPPALGRLLGERIVAYFTGQPVAYSGPNADVARVADQRTLFQPAQASLD